MAQLPWVLRPVTRSIQAGVVESASMSSRLGSVVVLFLMLVVAAWLIGEVFL